MRSESIPKDIEGFYEGLGYSIGAMVSRKQEEYGYSFHDSWEVLKILYPNGVEPEDYKHLLAVTRIIDKLFRIANGDMGEESAYKDIAGYGLLGMVWRMKP